MKILFSVLIPAFKKKFLRECIESILEQTYNDFELIIVNDASPENLDEVINMFSDKRIKYYVNEKNYGAIDVVHNWNKCLSYATGDYVICMGDDDCLKPNCLEEYNRLISENPQINLLHGWTEIINEKSEVIALTTHRCTKESAMSLLWHRTKQAYHSQYIGDFCYRTESLREKGGFKYFPLAWGSDEISAVIAAADGGVVNTQEVVFQYRKNSRTITSTGSIPLKLEAINSVEKWVDDYISSPCENDKDELYRKELNSLVSHYYQKIKSVLLISDFKHENWFRLFYWLRNRSKYDIQRNTVLYSFIRSFF